MLSSERPAGLGVPGQSRQFRCMFDARSTCENARLDNKKLFKYLISVFRYHGNHLNVILSVRLRDFLRSKSGIACLIVAITSFGVAVIHKIPFGSHTTEAPAITVNNTNISGQTQVRGSASSHSRKAETSASRGDNLYSHLDDASIRRELRKLFEAGNLEEATKAVISLRDIEGKVEECNVLVANLLGNGQYSRARDIVDVCWADQLGRAVVLERISRAELKSSSKD